MDLIQKAYNNEHFRQEGHALVDLLADYLKEAKEGAPMKIMPWKEGLEGMQSWEEELLRNPKPLPQSFFKKLIEESIHLLHPHYMGHQISPPVPLSSLAGLLSDFLNNGMGVYEMGTESTAIERVVIKQVAQQMGFDHKADGVLTSGGTLANTTALLTARSIKASNKVWQEGNQNKKFALMVSEQAHYCVDRAVRIMGWGEEGVIKIPSNKQFEMKTELLETYYQKAKAAGIEVLAVVGSACSTATGAYDNLDAIADFCEQHELWFHVDGAHGAAVVYSPKYQHLVKGIERADSVIMDFHKMLITPAITTALIFKEGKHNFQTFAQEAQYLFEEQEGLDYFNLAKRTFECTKVMMSLKVFITLRTYGNKLFDEYVTKVIDLTKDFAEILRENSDFELAASPKCNIICFRHLAPKDENINLNDWNEYLRKTLVRGGQFYIVKTKIQGKVFLRCTFTNPFTEKSHLKGLLKEIKATKRVIPTFKQG